jgi:flagellar biosynthesis protein FliR
MPNDVLLSSSTLLSFLLVLTRIAGCFVFVSFPGARHALETPKIVLSLVITLCLSSYWPPPPAPDPGIFQMAGWILSEAALGITFGLTIAFLMEAFTLAAQIFGLQAGYSYASTIDPMSQADSTVLQIFTHLYTGLLFFSTGADRHLIRAFAASLDTVPLGIFAPNAPVAAMLQKLGAGMLSTGLRVAMPLIAILLLIDLSLALLGRINSQLQLTTVAFPAKMAVALIALAGLAVTIPAVFEKSATQSFRTLESLGR